MTGAPGHGIDTARFVQAAGVAGLALSLLLVSLPRLKAAATYLPVDTALAHHWRGETPPPEQLDALSARAQAAILEHPHHRYFEGQSLLAYLQAMDPDLTPQQRDRSLNIAAETALEAVSRAPMNPAAWLRVATVRQSLGQTPEAVLPMLMMSVYSGRVEPTLLMLRLRMLHGMQNDMDPDQRRVVVDQTLLAWRLAPTELLGEIRSGAIAYDRIAGLLVPAHASIMDEIDEAIRASAR